MQFLLDKKQRGSLFEQAREQMITALHTGSLNRGDRLPSVRQTAQRNNINLKTAFSIYQRLRDEGYLELRGGSGAYVRDIESVGLDQAYCLSVLELIRANLSQAARLDLGPDEYGRLVNRFIGNHKTTAAQIGVVECNEEQVNLFSAEISSRLRVHSHPLLLSRFEKPDRRFASFLEKIDYFATTDYHFQEVKKLATPYDKRILRLRLNPEFVPTLIRAARNGRVLMVVSNSDFFPAFRRTLLGVGTPSSVLDRITAIDHTNPARVRAAGAHCDSVYISPLCDAEIERVVPRRLERLNVGTMLSTDSLEMLQAVLLFHP